MNEQPQGAGLRPLHRLSQWMVWAAGLALVATAIAVSAEVLVRKVFGLSINVGSELSSYVLAVCASWGFTFALFARSHVRVDALLRLLPPKLGAWLDLLALLGLTLFVGFLTWFGWGTFAESWQMNARSMTPLAVPIWIPQGLWVGGLLVFLLAALVLGALSLRSLVRGRYAESRRLIGVSLEDELMSEVEDIIAMPRGPQP